MTTKNYVLPYYVTKALEYFNAGNAYFNNNEIILAAEMYKQAISLYPKYFEAYYNLGICLNKLKELDKAREALEIALELRPDDPLVYQELGLNRLLAERYACAIPFYEMALKLNNESITCLSNLAMAYHKIKKNQKAKELLLQALNYTTNDYLLYFSLGKICEELKEYDEALEYYYKSIDINPNFTANYIQLGNIYKEIKRDRKKALEFYLKAKTNFETNSNQNIDEGVIIHSNQNIDEGVIIYFNLGCLYSDLFDFENSILYYRKAISLNPEHVESHWNLSLVLFMVEEFEEAFKEYAWRWKRENTFNMHIAKPVWSGEDISNKILLVHTEQGFGDAFMFIRFLPLVRNKCKKLILSTKSSLIEIFKVNNFADEYIQLELTNAFLHTFDVFIPLLDIPFVLRINKDTLTTQIPYIKADPNLVKYYNELLSPYQDKLKVVVAWRANPAAEYRKIKEFGFEYVQFLLDTENCVFFNVHPEVETLPVEADNFINLAPYVKDFSHTAAIMEAVDLTITLDSVLANLGGAMAVDTWVVLPYHHDWRYGRTATKSPWYPTLKLFRQPQEDDWQGVFNVVKEELRKRANKSS